MTYIGTLEASSPVYLSHTKIMYEYMEVFFLRDYKPYVAIAITALLASFTFSACTPITTIDQQQTAPVRGQYINGSLGSS